MAQNYTRQSAFSDGDTITATLFNDEYNQLVNTFTYSSSDASATGHRHDGSTGEGGNIYRIGDLDFLNKIEADSSNNRWGFWVEVSSIAVEQLRIQDGAIVPVTDNDIDLGTSSLEFKNLYLDGTAKVDTLVVDETATITGATTLSSTLGVTGATTLSSTLAVTGAATLSSDLTVTGNTTLGNAATDTVTITADVSSNIIPSADSTYTLGDSSNYWSAGYIDAITTTGNVSVGGNLTVTGNATISGNLTFGDADTDTVSFSADVSSHILPDVDDTYDLGSSTKEWRNLYVDGTANIDSLVADTADINGGTIDGAIIATSDVTVGAGKTLDVSAGTLTLADNQISGDKVEGGTIAATTITSLASTTVDTTNIEVTNLKAKDGTAAGSIADATGVVTLASSVLTTTDINGGAIDGTTIGGTTPAAASFTTVSATGNITVGGTVDGRDVAADGTKLDGIEAGADVTDTTNVTAAGALMDSELTNIAAVKALNQGVATTDSPSFAGLTATGSVSLAGASTTADITFGDNVSLRFGDAVNGDLVIKHDGTNSSIVDRGDGDLLIQGSTNVKLQNFTGSKDYFVGSNGGASTVYYDGSAKLATTATGIDVTGTVTADGLTVDGNGSFTGNFEISGLSPKIFLNETDTTDVNTRIRNAGGNLQIQTVNDSDASPTTRFDIDHATGDISFYEDTGTTPKFFWDASAEALGLGTTSPDRSLHVNSGGALIAARFESSSTVAARIALVDGNTTNDAKVGIGATGDALNLYSGGAIGLTIDASSNVGIGTTSPSQKLHVKDASPNIFLEGTSFPALKFAGTDLAVDAEIYYGMGGSDLNILNRNAGPMTFYTNNAEAMRITSAGNVGIGSSTIDGYYGSSPANTRAVIAYSSASTNVDTAPKGLVVRNDNTTTSNLSQMVFGTLNTGNTPIAVASIYSVNDARTSGFSTGSLGFGTVGGSGIISERMRIDSSGNLLVGKTSDNNSAVGASLRPTGVGALVADGNHAVVLNRLTSDGDIALFYKDSIEVGSIGTRGGDVYLETGDTGVRMYDQSDAIIPVGSSGVSRDAAIDLGIAFDRFKDLYLSGGVYLGGTGAANKLDDYETGTWTPSDASGDGLTLVTNDTSYTKIGRLCYIYAYITYPSTASGSTQTLGGLPFTAKGGATYAQLTVRSNSVSASNLTFQVSTGGTVGIIHSGATAIVNSDLSSQSILISGCYEVA